MLVFKLGISSGSAVHLRPAIINRVFSIAESSDSLIGTAKPTGSTGFVGAKIWDPIISQLTKVCAHL